jgi:CheY-like chemotaxis protein
MIEMRLLRHGFEVATLTPGEFSADRSASEKAAAAFVDVSMPEEEVVKAFEALRAAGTGKGFPVIAFAAGLNEDTLSQTAARHGAPFHLSAAGELGGLLHKICRPAAG